MAPDNPKLRPIQAVPVRHNGRIGVQLFDPSRLTDHALVVPRETMAILSLFDGSHSVVDIQTALLRATGEFVLSTDIQGLVDKLDEALLLESDHFRAHVRHLEEVYRSRPVRPPCSAGQGYPAAPDALRLEIDGHFSAQGLSTSTAPPASERLVGLVAPHIDLTRGGPTYAHAYQALATGASDAELFVIFGTAHYCREAQFILTRKNFQTPLGTVRTDENLVETIAQRAGADCFQEELVHATEHSIEFQVIFLQHLLDGRAVDILPILCGPLDRHVAEGQAPGDVPEVTRVLDAVRQSVAETGKRVCVIAGADLAHVGPQFGDDFDVTPQVMEDVERADRESLAFVESLDPDGFNETVQADRNARHVCGVAPIYALLKTADARRAELLDYRQASDPDLGRAVTFASLALYA